jgi:hypothetical protein
MKDAQRYHTVERLDRDQLAEAVILVGARNPERGQAAAAALRTECLDALYFELDVVSHDHRRRCRDGRRRIPEGRRARQQRWHQRPRRWSAGHGRPENDDFRRPKTTAPIPPLSVRSVHPTLCHDRIRVSLHDRPESELAGRCAEGGRLHYNFRLPERWRERR